MDETLHVQRAGTRGSSDDTVVVGNSEDEEGNWPTMSLDCCWSRCQHTVWPMRHDASSTTSLPRPPNPSMPVLPDPVDAVGHHEIPRIDHYYL